MTPEYKDLLDLYAETKSRLHQTEKLLEDARHWRERYYGDTVLLRKDIDRLKDKIRMLNTELEKILFGNVSLVPVVPNRISICKPDIEKIHKLLVSAANT